MKRHRIAIFRFFVTLAFFGVNLTAQQPPPAAPGAATQGSKKTAAPPATPQKNVAKPTTTTTKSSSNTVQWADLVKGGKLPYGGNVTLAGQLSDLTCGTQPISNVLNITGITVSYLGQTSPAATATIVSGSNAWTAPLGSLPADTAVNLQLKVTGNISAAKQSEIVGDLMADASFQRSLKIFLQSANGQTSVFTQDLQIMLNGISDKSGALTNALQSVLPSCVVVTDVTAAAVKGFAGSTGFINLPLRVTEFGKAIAPKTLDGYDEKMSPAELDAFIRASNGKYASNKTALTTDELPFVQAREKDFQTAYQSALSAFGGDVVAQLNQGVVLSQSSTTQDLNKYAGFDAGALYAPRINELRGFYMVHIYPTGPVDLDTSGRIPFLDRWSIAVGASTGDISSNGASRVKGDKAFVYGVGFRINKYFRVTAGGLLYRDAVGNRLLNELFIGPSIDITALPGLQSIFASSSSKSTTSTTKSTTAAPAGGSGAPQ